MYNPMVFSRVCLQTHIKDGQYLQLYLPEWDRLTMEDVEMIEGLIALQMRVVRAYVQKKTAECPTPSAS
jgi:hypothetical protein